jgi:hypothetical protein
MSKQSEEIDNQITHYRWLSNAVTDQSARDAIDRLIVKLEAQKASLHPDPEL